MLRFHEPWNAANAPPRYSGGNCVPVEKAIPSGAECAWKAIAGPSTWLQSAAWYSGLFFPGR
jgi:hypothetical protein